MTGPERVGSALVRVWYLAGHRDGLALARPPLRLDGLPAELWAAYDDGYHAGRAEAGLPPGETPQRLGRDQATRRRENPET